MSEHGRLSLNSWLQYIAAVHPREIELGLDRSRRVAARMQLTRPARHVITVAGTNGKGSCVACLEAILDAAGYSTAAYTSPHIHRFNERIRVAAADASDDMLVAALTVVESCRESDSLSYFEFATLAALWIFQQAEVDVALLEVGLGGRLDAVNIVDPDVAIITSISIDHEDWLGTGLENIGREKAGILRQNIPAIIGSRDPPRSVTQRAAEIGARLFVLDEDFAVQRSASAQSWQWRGRDADATQILLDQLPWPKLEVDNAACAIQAVKLLPLEIADNAIKSALESVALAARFELRRDLRSGKLVILDVAHNVAAAALLALNLRRFLRANPKITKITGVIAVLADKNIEDIVSTLESCLNIWYIAQIDEARSMSVDETAQRLQNLNSAVEFRRFDSVVDAYQAACAAGPDSAEQELVVVTGSFHTVAAIRDLSLTEG
jgi:dihydrofolate synthase/folylpolyglutamate synthase